MEDEINLLDYWRVLLKRKKMLATIVGLATVLSIAVSLLLPKVFRAQATLMPIGGQSGGGLGAVAAQLGLGALLGGFDQESSSAQLLAILKSQTVAEKVIEQFDLMKVFFEGSGSKAVPTMEDAVKALFNHVTFSEDKKNQLIAISAEFHDPRLAAEIVNGYIHKLVDHINKNAFTVAKRNRIFIEGQLERNKTELLESGKELTVFYSTNKISNVVPTVDVDVGIRTMDDGRETMAEGPAMSGHQPSSPDSKSHKWFGVPSAFADTQRKTNDVQKVADEVGVKMEQAKVVKEVPQQVYLQYLTLRRELLGQVNALLTQQYEMAKIEEAKEDLNFQVIDWARAPVRKYKPKRARIVLTTFMFAIFLSVFYAFFREYWEKMKSGAASGLPRHGN